MNIRIQPVRRDGGRFGGLGREIPGKRRFNRTRPKNAGTGARNRHASRAVGEDRDEYANERETRSALVEFLVTGPSRNRKRNAHDDLFRIERRFEQVDEEIVGADYTLRVRVAARNSACRASVFPLSLSLKTDACRPAFRLCTTAVTKASRT